MYTLHHENRENPREGFTLTELIVVVAIIALLAAIAIPQFRNFVDRSKRAEAYIAANAAHKAQTAYFADAEHYLDKTVLGAGVCSPDPTCSIEINQYFGLANGNTTKEGYVYVWNFDDSSPISNYILSLYGPLSMLHGTLPEQMLISVNFSDLYSTCVSYGYQDGVPYLLEDGILQVMNCPW